MNPRTTALLLLVAAALGAAIYWIEVRGGEQRRLAEEASRQLFPGIEAHDIDAIELTTADGVAVRAERREGQWWILAPREAPGDEVAWDGIAAALADMASEATFDEPEAPEVYGLGDAARVVRFRAAGREHVLRLGRKTPVGGNTYAAADEDPRVFTVASYRASPFTRRFEELRDRRLVRVDREAVRRIEASWPEGRVVLERAEDGWHLREPLDARADEATVQTLLSDLQFLRAEGFVDEPTPEVLAKLDPPAFRVVLELAPEDAEGTDETAAQEARSRRLEVVIGAPLDDETRVARGASGALFRIPAERLDDFPRSVTAYRFKELTDFDPSDVARIEMVFRDSGDAEPTRTVVAEATPDGWKTSPIEIEPEAMASLVSRLAHLRAEGIVAESMGPDELAGVGLAPPRVVYRVYGRGEADEGAAPLLAEVHLGVADAVRGIVARVPDRDTVYRLPYGLAEDLPVSAEALHARFEKRPEGAVGEDAPAEEPGEAGSEPASAADGLAAEEAEEDAAVAGEAGD